MKQCSKCILPEDFPNIKFDEQGICNYCHAWDKKWKNFDYQQAEQKLIAIFKNVQAKKRPYDCLIPYSGGRDSSYVVYLCKQKYGLHPLVVTFNNLFMSEYAFRNIFRTVAKLNVDHIFFTYQPDIVQKFYASMVRKGGEFCSICTAGINYVTLMFQKRYNIPLIVYGTSTRVDEQSPFEVTSTHPIYVRKALLQSGYSLEEINAYLIPRRDETPAGEKVKMKLFDRDYEQLNLPDYIPWNNQEIQRVLEQELEWETPDKQRDHIDCKFAAIKYYLKNKQIPHYIFKQEKYSQLIRDGQMIRADALEAFRLTLAHEDEEPDELQEFLEFLKLQPEEIVNQEKRSHRNYITKADTEIKESALYRKLALPWKMIKRMM
jgi:N-acetyl sugar amidotransferase